MTIALPSLSQLDPVAVAAIKAEIVQRVQEANPSLELRRGLFADLLVYLQAILETQIQANIATYLQARSLSVIQANPSLADPTLIAEIVSNFGLVPGTGAVATGQITIILADNVPVVVPQGTIWTAAGQTFTATATFTAKNVLAQINNSSDRLLTATLSGQWAFTIDVVATLAGSAGNINANTSCIPSSAPLNFVSAYAVNSFTGGIDPETITQLLARLQSGVAASTLGNRANMQAFLRDLTGFTAVTAQSVIGCGDAELLRDHHSIFPVAVPGHVDWYVRTQESLQEVALTKTAVLVAKTGVLGTWQFSLGKDDAPAFYEIRNIALVGSGAVLGGFTITLDQRSLDLTGTGFVPDIVAAIEGVYTRYQTAIIQFQDTLTDASALALGATKSYQLQAASLPSLGVLQDTVNLQANRGVASDCLIKAPIPCFLQIAFDINIHAGDAAPDTAAIITAVCAMVNTLGFTGQVSASQVSDVVHSYLGAGQTVTGLDLLGRLRYPDASMHYVHSGDVLQVPTDLPNMVSPNTVQFFLNAADVTINVNTL